MLKQLFEKYPILKQGMRFIVVGLLNTGIDFLVLNLEMFATGISSGRWMFLLNSVSFSVATINSYFLNKHWTFQDKKDETGEKQAVKFSQFLIVSVIGIVINSAIVYLITTFINPIGGINNQLWANLAKVAATGISLFWNFLGYKFIVFKK